MCRCMETHFWTDFIRMAGTDVHTDTDTREWKSRLMLYLKPKIIEKFTQKDAVFYRLQFLERLSPKLGTNKR